MITPIRKSTKNQLMFFLFVTWLFNSTALLFITFIVHDKPINNEHIGIMLFVIFISGGFCMSLIDMFKAYDQTKRKNRTHHHG